MKNSEDQSRDESYNGAVRDGDQTTIDKSKDLLDMTEDKSRSFNSSQRAGAGQGPNINQSSYSQSFQSKNEGNSFLSRDLGKQSEQISQSAASKQNDSEEDDANAIGSRVIQVLAENKEKRRVCCKFCCYQSIMEMFKTNVVRTGKYNLLTFLPLNLKHQFSKIANLYFLLMAAMETYKPISSSEGTPVTLIPLSFVVGLALIKDAYEDIKRHMSDRRENLKPANVVVVRETEQGPIERKFETIQWREIKVGQIVKVEENEYFPCDLVLLNSDLPNGVCYVETKNLDGETNLKHKKADGKTVELCKSDQEAIANFTGSVLECDKENEFIYKFTGQLRMTSNDVIGLGEEQILLRGSSLRNTGYIWGIAVYTGHDSKVMMNQSRGIQKKTKLEIAMNRYVLITLLIQFLLSLAATVFNALWTMWRAGENPTIDPFYLELTRTYTLSTDGLSVRSDEQRDEVVNTRFVLVLMAQGLGKWMLSSSNFVAISLLTSLEIAKFWQAVFIGWDSQMFDEEQQQFAQAQQSSLNEELGQISYIFSDKTGTLTKNIMEFKSFTAGFEKYGSIDDQIIGEEEAQRQQKATDEGITNVNFQDDKFWEQWQNKEAKNQKYLEKVINILAVCHTIVPEVNDDGILTYNASSPDELALTNAARFFGYVFEHRDSANIVTINNKQTGEKQTYELLNVIEFTSLRKRMSVIVRTPDNKILCMCKGADSIITPRLYAGQDDLVEKTEELLDEYANQGLRTLLLAQREIKPEFYEEWNKKYENALAQIVDREKCVNQVSEEIECEFELVGSTAIEDKLQDNVSKVISDIRAAGIKFWVLTGDKIETAINIGFSCNVLDNEMEIFIINDPTRNGIEKQLESFMKIQRSLGLSRDSAIVIGGEQLAKITACSNETQRERMLEQFFQLTEKASVVIACRVSPKQKAEVVKFVRQKKKEQKKEVTTLAIGDGANDVNMITAAHLGVGISGLEGQQASRAADYSICQFQFLKNLLFTHGRECYRRNAFLINYTFYKNVLLVMPIFFFGIFSAFSGVLIYDVMLYQLYNTLMTGLPVGWLAVYDWQYSKQELLNNPAHYKIGLKNKCFSPWIFWRWWFYAIWQSFFILMGTLILLDQSKPYVSIVEWMRGNHNDHQIVQSSLFVWSTFLMQAVILLVSLKIFISSSEHTLYSIVILVVCVLSFYVYLLLANWWVDLPVSDLVGVGTHLLPFIGNYLLLFPIVFAFMIIDVSLWHFNHQIQLAYDTIEEEQEYVEAENKKSAVMTRNYKISTYRHTGFAFDAEAGHDILVTDNLKKRFKYALDKQFNSNMMPFAFNMWSNFDGKSQKSSSITSSQRTHSRTQRKQKSDGKRMSEGQPVKDGLISDQQSEILDESGYKKEDQPYGRSKTIKEQHKDILSTRKDL